MFKKHIFLLVIYLKIEVGDYISGEKLNDLVKKDKENTLYATLWGIRYFPIRARSWAY